MLYSVPSAAFEKPEIVWFSALVTLYVLWSRPSSISAASNSAEAETSSATRLVFSASSVSVAL